MHVIGLRTSDPLRRKHAYHSEHIYRALLSVTRILVLCCLAGFPGVLVASAATATTTALAVSPQGPLTTLAAGSSVTLTATVTAGSAVVSPGQVVFCDATAEFCQNSAALGIAQLTPAGTAILRLVPGIGTHSYKAVFTGTKRNSSSTSSPQTLTVTGTNAPKVTITSSGSPGGYSLAGTVNGSGLLPFTGTVSFLDTSNNFTLGTATLSTASLHQSSYASSSPSTGLEPSSIATADFNGDGKMDLVVANYGFVQGTPVNGLTILLGNGDGTFTAGPASPLINESVFAVAVGDFNNDGKADLAVINATDNTVTILVGTGDGAFSDGRHISISSADIAGQSIAVGDFNNDGNIDLAITNGTNTPTILLGNGSGAFSLPSSGQNTAQGCQFIVVGDFNGDGNLDLALANPNNTVTILLGSGDGTFVEDLQLNVTGSFRYMHGSVAIGDFNGDGKADLAAGTVDHPAGHGEDLLLNVFLGNGDGTFSALPAFTAIQGSTNDYAIAAADLDGDGKTDLVAVSDAGSPGFGSINIGGTAKFLSNGDGTFSAGATTTSISDPDWRSLVVGDFNGDGIPDIANSNSDLNAVSVLLTHNNWIANADLNNVLVPGTGSHNVEATFVGNAEYSASTSGVIALTAVPVTTRLQLGSSTNSSSSGEQVTLTATLSPYSDQSLTTNGESIAFYNGTSSIGAGTLSSGVATLNASALPVGTDSLTAVYAGDADFASSTSSAISVLVGAAVSPTISSMSPAFTGAGGAAFPLTVNGSGFTSNSLVYWGTSALATTYVSAAQLTAQVSVPDIQATGSTAITVQNPASEGGTSNSLQFQVDSANSGTNPPAFATSAQTVTAGSAASYQATLPSTVTSASITCLNLPAGATCSYSASGTVTIATSSTTPKGTYQVIVVFAETMPGAATAEVLLPMLLLPFMFRRKELAMRGIWGAALLGLLLTGGAAYMTGCGGEGSTASGPGTPATHQVTSSGTVTLTIQ